jgi:hypothetical protein
MGLWMALLYFSVQMMQEVVVEGAAGVWGIKVFSKGGWLSRVESSIIVIWSSKR